MQGCIVVADDDPAVLRAVKKRLGMAQYTVAAAEDSGKALAMVHSREPVAVILDVQMPGGGGLSALSKIKADPKTRNLPVMMLTGERNAETVMEAMDAGADDYMVKPFHPDALLERVSRLVQQGRQSPQPASRPGSSKAASVRARPAGNCAEFVQHQRPRPVPPPAPA